LLSFYNKSAYYSILGLDAKRRGDFGVAVKNFENAIFKSGKGTLSNFPKPEHMDFKDFHQFRPDQVFNLLNLYAEADKIEEGRL